MSKALTHWKGPTHRCKLICHNTSEENSHVPNFCWKSFHVHFLLHVQHSSCPQQFENALNSIKMATFLDNTLTHFIHRIPNRQNLQHNIFLEIHDIYTCCQHVGNMSAHFHLCMQATFFYISCETSLQLGPLCSPWSCSIGLVTAQVH